MSGPGCTDPDCHANAFAAAHGDGCPDPSAHACPYGDKYAHHFTDLLPARPWDPDSKPRATEPCPLGYGCPVHQPYTIVNTDSTAPLYRTHPHADDDPTADTAY